MMTLDALKATNFFEKKKEIVEFGYKNDITSIKLLIPPMGRRMFSGYLFLLLNGEKIDYDKLCEFRTNCFDVLSFDNIIFIREDIFFTSYHPLEKFDRKIIAAGLPIDLPDEELSLRYAELFSKFKAGFPVLVNDSDDLESDVQIGNSAEEESTLVQPEQQERTGNNRASFFSNAMMSADSGESDVEEQIQQHWWCSTM